MPSHSRGVISEDQQRYIYNDLSYSLDFPHLAAMRLKESKFIWTRDAIRKIIMTQALASSFIIIAQVLDLTSFMTNHTSTSMMDHLGAGIWIPLINIPAMIFSAYTFGNPTYILIIISAGFQAITLAIGTFLQALCLHAEHKNLNNVSISDMERTWGGILYAVILLSNTVVLACTMLLLVAASFDILTCRREQSEATDQLI